MGPWESEASEPSLLKPRAYPPRPLPPCPLPSEGEVAEPQWGMRPGLPFLLVATFCGPGRGFAGDVALAGDPAGLVAPHLPCPALT